MYEDNLLEKVLIASHDGKDIITQLYPESVPCFGTSKKFRIRGEDIDKTPSASVKLLTSHTGMRYWGVTDFGGDIHGQNAVGVFALYHGISFSEALKTLAERYNVILSVAVNKPTIQKEPAKPNEPNGRYIHSVKSFSADELRLWGQFVTPEVLDRYGWYSLIYYSVTRNGSTITVFANENYPIFARDCGDFWKLYQPNNPEKKYRFQYHPKELGKTVTLANKVFGIEQIEKDYAQLNNNKSEECKLDAVFICSGERDAMNLAGMGYYSVWLGSETATLSKSVIHRLSSLCETIYNIPDIDTTGIREGRKKALEFPEIYTIELPPSLRDKCDNRGNACKDFRDYVATAPKDVIQANFRKLMNVALCAQFWFMGNKGWVIKSVNMLYYLKLCGFHKWLEAYSDEYIMVRVQTVPTEQNGSMQVVERLNPRQVRDFLRAEIKSLHLHTDILEAFINSKKTNLSMVEDLETINLNFQSATATKKYLFFQNGCFYVDKDCIRREQNPPCCVWKHKIIPHKFVPQGTFWKPLSDGGYQYLPHESFVYKYITNSCRMFWRAELEERNDGDLSYQERFKFSLYGSRLKPFEIEEQVRFMNSKIFSIGFLMHNYKTDKMAKVLYLLENKNVDEETNAGGSGKSLFIKCFDRLHLLTIDYQDGRNKKLVYNAHYLERINSNTDIVNFEDLDRSIDLATFYTMVDSGLTINPKGKQSYHLPFTEAPNIVFSSNSAPNNLDPSTLRRLRFVQFSDYYHKQTPFNRYQETREVHDDFDGLELFSEGYTEEMYNNDINFIIGCLQFYLKNISENNYCEPPMANSILRMERQEIGEVMLSWFEQYVIERERLNCLIVRDAAYADYLAFCGPKIIPKTRHKFKEAFLRCCNYKGYEFNPDGLVGRQENGRIIKKIRYHNRQQTQELFYVRSDNAELNEVFIPDDNARLE